MHLWQLSKFKPQTNLTNSKNQPTSSKVSFNLFQSLKKLQKLAISNKASIFFPTLNFGKIEGRHEAMQCKAGSLSVHPYRP